MIMYKYQFQTLLRVLFNNPRVTGVQQFFNRAFPSSIYNGFYLVMQLLFIGLPSLSVEYTEWLRQLLAPEDSAQNTGKLPTRVVVYKAVVDRPRIVRQIDRFDTKTIKS